MTSYDEVIDLALVSIEDYRLNKISNDSPADFSLIMQGFMIRGLVNFDNCNQDLSDRDETKKEFNLVLRDIEKSIIADYKVMAWLEKEMNDTRQIVGMLQNKNEAHRFSEANNLKVKIERYNQLYENVCQKKTSYSLKYAPWRDWANGSYEL